MVTLWLPRHEHKHEPSCMKLKCLKKLVSAIYDSCATITVYTLIFSKILVTYFFKKIHLLKAEYIHIHVKFIKPKSSQQ